MEGTHTGVAHWCDKKMWKKKHFSNLKINKNRENKLYFDSTHYAN